MDNEIKKDIQETTEQSPPNSPPEESKTTPSASPSEGDIKEKSGLSDEIALQMMDLLKTQNQTIIDLKSEVAKAKDDLQEFKNKIESEKPLNIRAEVKGFYPYEKDKSRILSNQEETELEAARKIYDRINSEFNYI